MTDVDRFCPTRTDDPYWNESVWFSFSLPERGIHGLIYYFFRPNMKLLMGGPILWDRSGETRWNCLYDDWHHLQPMPAACEKFAFTAPNSLTVQILEPVRRYRIGYDANGFKLALDWTAIAVPHHFLGMEVEATGASPDNRMHLEQMGRVTGRIEHLDQTYDVDCFSLRDTSWGRRQLDSTITGSYFWAIADARTAFHAMTLGEGDEQKLAGGFLMRDGEIATFANGTRIVRQMGRYAPATFELSAQDQRGRRVQLTAHSSSEMLFCGYPRVQVVWSLLEANLDGKRAYGDMQEFTPLEAFRCRQRSLAGAR